MHPLSPKFWLCSIFVFTLSWIRQMTRMHKMCVCVCVYVCVCVCVCVCGCVCVWVGMEPACLAVRGGDNWLVTQSEKRIREMHCNIHRAIAPDWRAFCLSVQDIIMPRYAYIGAYVLNILLRSVDLNSRSLFARLSEAVFFRTLKTCSQNLKPWRVCRLYQ